MPNCFQLKHRETGEATPFVQVDNELCQVLGVEPDDTQYVYGWYDSIGLGLAMGVTWEKMRTWWDEDSPMQKVIEYLETHYTPDVWYQPK